MTEEIQPIPCIKCGHSESTIEYKQIITSGEVYAVDPDLLWVRCSRCSFLWTTPTLDAQRRERPVAEPGRRR